MTCDDVRALLEEYADGELDSGRDAAVLKHVSACTACGAELDQLQRLESLLRRASPDRWRRARRPRARG